MPAAAGALFALPMVGFVWMLAQLPPPTAEDEAQRSHRAPMDGAARWAFVRRFAPGILTLTGLHILLTSYRDFRDNFSREIYDAVGLAGDTAVFATAEVPVAAGVLVVLALMALIKDNRKALVAIHLIMAGGCALIGASTLMWTSGLIGPVTWMILVGLGLYIAYVPFGSMLFDRLFAATGAVGTAGFLIYVTDAFGYLGSVGLLFFKNFGFKELSWLDFFLQASFATAVVCGACFVFAAAYFGKVARRPAEG